MQGPHAGLFLADRTSFVGARVRRDFSVTSRENGAGNQDVSLAVSSHISQTTADDI